MAIKIIKDGSSMVTPNAHYLDALVAHYPTVDFTQWIDEMNQIAQGDGLQTLAQWEILEEAINFACGELNDRCIGWHPDYPECLIECDLDDLPNPVTGEWK